MHHLPSGRRLFRVWITTYEAWRPARWNEVPPDATALELFEDAAYSAQEAAQVVRGFNSAVLGQDRRIWAVAVPVVIRYEGDAHRGANVQGFELDGP